MYRHSHCLRHHFPFYLMFCISLSSKHDTTSKSLPISRINKRCCCCCCCCCCCWLLLLLLLLLLLSSETGLLITERKTEPFVLILTARFPSFVLVFVVVVFLFTISLISLGSSINSSSPFSKWDTMEAKNSEAIFLTVAEWPESQSFSSKILPLIVTFLKFYNLILNLDSVEISK